MRKKFVRLRNRKLFKLLFIALNMGLMGKIAGAVKSFVNNKPDFSYLKVINETKNIAYFRVSGNLEQKKRYKAKLTNTSTGQTSTCSFSYKDYAGLGLWDISSLGNVYLSRRLTQEEYALELKGVIERYKARLQKENSRNLKELRRFEELIEGLKGNVTETTMRNLESIIKEARKPIIEARRYEIFKKIVTFAKESRDEMDFARKIKEAGLYSMIARRAEKNYISYESAIGQLYRLKEKPYFANYDSKEFKEWFQTYKSRKKETKKLDMEKIEKLRIRKRQRLASLQKAAV